MGSTYLCWRLDRADRDELLVRFPPRYARTEADHVTFGKAESAPPMPQAARATLVGRADDDQGVEAMVVEIAGTRERPGGGTCHITWSLADGRHARQSNDVIASRGWTPLDARVDVRVALADWTA